MNKGIKLFTAVAGSYSVLAKNLLTQEILEFSSIRKASTFFNNTFIAEKLRNGFQPLLETGWQIKYSHQSWNKVKNFEKEIYKLSRDIMAKSEETGKCILAKDSVQLANILNLKSQDIRKAALTRGNKLHKGYRFRLGKTSEPWPTTITATNCS